MDYVEAGTTCESKGAFERVLRDWLASDHETTIGEPGPYGAKPLILIKLDGQGFHLNADSRDDGVTEYLRLVDRHGPDVPWHVIANNRGRVNAVAFGEPPTKIQYFYLYTDDEADAPYTV